MSEFKKTGMAPQMLVVGHRDRYTQTWINMAYWGLKYVWYEYYASTNTGAERERKEED